MNSTRTKKARRINQLLEERVQDNIVRNEQMILEEKRDAGRRNLDKASVTLGQTLANKRNALHERQRAVAYPSHFMTIALTECLTDLAVSSLLLNKDEYFKLNENYKDDIKNNIKTMLENADLVEQGANSPIKFLIEKIVEVTPSHKLYLTEEDEVELIKSNILNNNEITDELHGLQRDIQARVADIVLKDQENLSNDEAAIEDIKSQSEIIKTEIEGVSDDIEQEVEEIIEDDKVQPMVDPDAEVKPVQDEVEEVVTESTNSFKVFRKTKSMGIVETLALNEAMDMIRDEKEYNKTLALANAIKTITCLETLDAAGVIEVGEQGYRQIMKNNGTEVPAVEKVQDVDIIDDVLDNECEVVKEESELTKRIRNSIPANLSHDSGIFKPVFESNLSKFNNKEVTNVVTEKADFEDIHGKQYSTRQLYEFFENKGFYGVDTNADMFHGLWTSWNFKRIK